MRSLQLPKSLIWAAAVLIVAQFACGTGRPIAATIAPPSPVATTASSPQPSLASHATETAPSAAATTSGENGSPAEAQAMLEAAVQHYQAVGRQQALKDFTARKPPFANKDLYVVCLGSDHTMTANGEYPMLVGLSADAINGPGGRPLGEAVWSVASALPRGSVPIKFDNPFTGKSESKILYYQKLDQDVCGVAANSSQ